jgi:hypothetical protein
MLKASNARALLPSLTVEIKKTVQEHVGADVTSGQRGLRIDTIIPGGLVDKSEALKPLDRIVKVNGVGVTGALSKKDVERVFAVRDPVLTVSRFSCAELEAAEKEIQNEAAKKDAELLKYGDVDAMKRFVADTDRPDARCVSEGQEKLRAECPEILFLRDLAELALDVMREADKEFATRWTMKKVLYASAYKQRLDMFKSELEK